MKRSFILHWLDGKAETVDGEGSDQHSALANACMCAGYGGGAMAALDYWEESMFDSHGRAIIDPVCRDPGDSE